MPNKLTTMNEKILSLLISLLTLCSPLFSQNSYIPSKDNLENREQFMNDKFGIFIHWGLYSMMADGEWVMQNRDLNHLEYRKLASGFYPSRFNADDWVKAIKESGARYICVTSRHHDGFSMFDSKFTDYDIVDATPFKRDIMQELSDACKKYGIKLHIYYSHLDWDREDYPLGRTGLGTGRKGKADWNSYFNFMNNQITELLTKYDARALWFDGWWDHDIHPGFNWHLDEQYALIHKIKPSCLIGNNHHQKPFPGEDFQMFERDLPTENKSGLSGQEISHLPLETCETMNGMWGYKMKDTSYKTAKELIHYLVKAAGNNANLLLNVGPQPNGEIPQMALDRFKELGKWLNTYGETIYGTRAGLIEPRDWGVTTQKGNKLFVHILNLKEEGLYLPIKGNKIKSAVTFADKMPVKFIQDKDGVLLKLQNIPSDIDQVIELSL